MMQFLETARTFLRPFALADTELANEWFSDSEVMQFIPHGADESLNATVVRVRRYIAHQETHGFSKWIVFERASGTAIGDAGFFLMPDEKRVELGFRLTRRFWRRGLATEVAGKWLEVAHSWFGLDQVFAFAHPENVASLRVMTKLGFEFHRNEQLYGLEEAVYVRNCCSS